MMDPALYFYIAVGLATIVHFVAWVSILSKAGFSPWLACLILLPVVNLCVIVWFAAAKWPLEHGSTLREVQGERPSPVQPLVQGATMLEYRGKYDEAISLYNLIVEMDENPGNRELARERARAIREKLEQM